MGPTVKVTRRITSCTLSPSSLSPGEPLTLEVTVNPVPGEQITTNNRFTYQLTFR